MRTKVTLARAGDPFRTCAAFRCLLLTVEGIKTSSYDTLGPGLSLTGKWKWITNEGAKPVTVSSCVLRLTVFEEHAIGRKFGEMWTLTLDFDSR